MASAETARLIASLELQDKFTPGIARADRALAGFERRRRRPSAGSARASAGRRQQPQTFATSTRRPARRRPRHRGRHRGHHLGHRQDDRHGRRRPATSRPSPARLDRARRRKWVDVLDKFGISGDTAVKTYSRLLVNAEKYGGTSQERDQVPEAVRHQPRRQQGPPRRRQRAAEAQRRLLQQQRHRGPEGDHAHQALRQGLADAHPAAQGGRKGIEEEFGSALTLTPKQIKRCRSCVEVQRDWNDTVGDAPGEDRRGAHPDAHEGAARPDHVLRPEQRPDRRLRAGPREGRARSWAAPSAASRPSPRASPTPGTASRPTSASSCSAASWRTRC